MAAPQSELFPTIGKVVADTAKADQAQITTAEEDDERPVQEVESLCMKCYKQVRFMYPYHFYVELMPTRNDRV